MREKQIEEMAKDLLQSFCVDFNMETKRYEINFMAQAEALYNAGYRKQSNEVTTEKDGGEKKQTAERRFTPEDVCKMSPKEVQENYTAIMKSMKKWN